MSQENNWGHVATHATGHLMKHALETEPGKQVVRRAATAVVAVATAIPPLLPLVAVGGAVAGLIWWFSKE